MNDSKTEMPFRKQLRLKGYHYSQAGYYFITICTLLRRETLGHVVGGDAHIAPPVLLSRIGEITQKYINHINTKYESVRVDKYVIMPNHIHMIIALENGAMWASPPTDGAVRLSRPADALLPKIVRSLKTLVTKEAGAPVFQESYYDHIVRDEADYLAKWDYIDTNPARWADDEYAKPFPLMNGNV